MLPGMFPMMMVAPSLWFDIIGSVNLQGSLQVCLDAGDSMSYDGTSQTWKDRSGHGNDYFRGLTNASSSDDPTFNGIAGRQSIQEFFGFDGGDGFCQTTTQSYTNNWHKAGQQFSCAAWLYVPAGQAHNVIVLGNGGNGTGAGFSCGISQLSSGGRAYVGISNASGPQFFSGNTTGVVSENVWQFYGWSWHESSYVSFVTVNGTSYPLLSDTVTSPNAASPPIGNGVGAGMNTGTTFSALKINNGGKMRAIGAFSSMLSQTQMGQLFAASRDLYGV